MQKTGAKNAKTPVFLSFSIDYSQFEITQTGFGAAVIYSSMSHQVIWRRDAKFQISIPNIKSVDIMKPAMSIRCVTAMNMIYAIVESI